MTLPYEKYETGDYLKNNPEWDSADSAWKAKKVHQLVIKNKLKLNSICDVGCGAGVVLSELVSLLNPKVCHGFDISPDLPAFWEKYKNTNIKFNVGQFTELASQSYDLVLLLDVLEHLPNPHQFLKDIKNHSQYFIFHFPLDLSSLSVLRETPLLNVREKVGHIHYFTKSLAQSLLSESGYEIIDIQYTGAYLSVPQKNLKTYLAILPRLFCSYVFSKDFATRLLGGETLLILAKIKS